MHSRDKEIVNILCEREKVCECVLEKANKRLIERERND